MGYAIPAFPTVLSKKFASLLTDVNGNGYADSGDTIEYFIDIVNVGFATANNVIFQDDLPTNLTAYVTNSAMLASGGSTNAVPDSLPPKLTRFRLTRGRLQCRHHCPGADHHGALRHAGARRPAAGLRTASSTTTPPWAAPTATGAAAPPSRSGSAACPSRNRPARPTCWSRAPTSPTRSPWPTRHRVLHRREHPGRPCRWASPMSPTARRSRSPARSPTR
jgi:uncharacterized repeat protein (TIGR01451 family)